MGRIANVLNCTYQDGRIRYSLAWFESEFVYVGGKQMKYSACVAAALLIAGGCTQNADPDSKPAGPGAVTEVRVINIKPALG